MSSDVWFAIPSANAAKARHTLPAWRDMGYRVAVLQDRFRHDVDADLVVRSWTDWRGWVASVNHLVRLPELREADVIVTGGDDMYPDPKLRAEEIREQFLDRFPGTFGVMQPTGDTMDGTDRICGSPWMGRAFRDLLNCGRGPFWPEYFNFYADEEMFEVARTLGVLWQRPDLVQRHDHWSLAGTVQPLYLRAAQKLWHRDEFRFLLRRTIGFPGAEPFGARARYEEAMAGAKA